MVLWVGCGLLSMSSLFQDLANGTASLALVTVLMAAKGNMMVEHGITLQLVLYSVICIHISLVKEGLMS